MLIPTRPVAGFSLVEMMTALVVIGILFMVGLPSLATWMQNTQLRNSAESVVNGLQLARNEAVRRNRTVQFSLVDTLDASCALSAAGTSWVVSVDDPAGLCDAAPGDTVPPQIVQKGGGAEGSPNAVVAAVGASRVTFNGLGRIWTAVGAPASFTQVDITNPSGGNCQTAGGVMRCLRVTVSLSGSVRMCDPAVTDAADPRLC
jgi:type IV fimbrial biogenesis protein FimT